MFLCFILMIVIETAHQNLLLFPFFSRCFLESLFLKISQNSNSIRLYVLDDIEGDRFDVEFVVFLVPYDFGYKALSFQLFLVLFVGGLFGEEFLVASLVFFVGIVVVEKLVIFGEGSIVVSKGLSYIKFFIISALISNFHLSDEHASILLPIGVLFF